MALTEFLKRREPVEIQETPVVRVLLTQPISFEDLKTRLDKSPDTFDYQYLHQIGLSRSWWEIKGVNAENPGQIMPIGGKISDEDRKRAKEIISKSELDAENRRYERIIPEEWEEALTHRIAACRESLYDVHLQGVPWEMVSELDDALPRTYLFRHSKRGIVKNQEHWMSAWAPPVDFQPFALNPAEHIEQIVALTPREVRWLFRNNRYRQVVEGQVFYYPLIENLRAKRSLEQAGKEEILNDPVLRLQESILRGIDTSEIVCKLHLAYEMIYFADNHPIFGQKAKQTLIEQQDARWDKLIDSAGSIATFNKAYDDFLQYFAQTIPVAYTTRQWKMEKAQLKALKEAMLRGWHKATFKMRLHHASSLPSPQADILAARLELQDIIGNDELEEIEEFGPEYFQQLSQFIRNALTPPAHAEAFKYLETPPATVEERYQRLALFQSLLLRESELSDDELTLLSDWEPHMYKALNEAFQFPAYPDKPGGPITIKGIDFNEFAAASRTYNFLWEDVGERIITRVAQRSSAPALLHHTEDSEVTQLEELLLTSHGLSQYYRNRRGSAISPQTIIDSRIKLTAIPYIVRALRYYDAAIHHSTYYWRRALVALSTGIIGYTDKEIDTQPNPSEPYTIYRKEVNGQDQMVVCRTEEAEQAGAAIGRTKTLLESDGVPLYILRTTKDKRPESLLRKGWERGRQPETILDVYRTAMTIDTETEEVKTALKQAYQRYVQSCRQSRINTMNYNDWLKDWSIKAIRDILQPKIAEIAEALGYQYQLTQIKDRLETGEPSGGSAASLGGYFHTKCYASIDQKHILAGGEEEKSAKAVTIEWDTFLNIGDMLTKILDDDEYATRRYETVAPGSPLYTLWSLFYPPIHNLYTSYADLAGRRIRNAQLAELRRSNLQRVRRFLLQTFGPVITTVFRRDQPFPSRVE
jgi:hypothetical protein